MRPGHLAGVVKFERPGRILLLGPFLPRRRCPVTIDQTRLDVTGAGVFSVTEAVLMGRQGVEEISGRELAEQAGAVAWQIVTGLGPGVNRVYA